MIAPSGMASMAARVEIGDPQLSGVARSSRAGTNRNVKARPTSRPWPGLIGRVPRIQTLRRPFFSRIVVMLAVVTLDRACLMSSESGVVCTVSPSGVGTRGARSQRAIVAIVLYAITSAAISLLVLF